MPAVPGVLPPTMRQIIEEEESLCARVAASIAALQPAAPPVSDQLAAEGLRALREEALGASPEDLPALLREMEVRQALRARAAAAPVAPAEEISYLAHLRVREGTATRDYLLGPRAHVDSDRGVRIVHWRDAPIARIFHHYREGDLYEEELPGRVAEGTVEARRLVSIAGNKVVGIIGGGVALVRRAEGDWAEDEGRSLALRAGGGGSAVRPGALGEGGGAGPAVALEELDEVQIAAVHAPPGEPLLVLGTAGSGKTTVALHRLARLTARAGVAGALVVVPEEGLARLARRLLAPLGAGEAQVQTIDGWAVGLAREVFEGKLPGLWPESPGLVAKLKRHPALFDALRAHFASWKPAKMRLKTLRRELGDLFTDRLFLDAVVAASGGDLPASTVEVTTRHTMLQLAETTAHQLRSITSAERKQAIDGRPIAEGTPDELAGTIDLEDLPILLFLRAWRAGLGAPRVSHLVLEEAEDFSLFELSVLGYMLGPERSVALAGDEAQQTSSCFAGWPRVIEALGVGEPRTCRLGLSYRCPRPVTELARAVLGGLGGAPAQAAKEGPPVGFFPCASEAAAQLLLGSALRDLLGQEPRASVAVIAPGASEARRLAAGLAPQVGVRLVLDGEFSFEPGIDVTDVASIKGLEFDYVILPEVSAAAYPATDESRRQLHVAITRTSFQLWGLASGPPSPLWPAAGLT